MDLGIDIYSINYFIVLHNIWSNVLQEIHSN